MEDYNFTTSGIFSTLKYILEVKHINIKEYDSIGLVPYLYNEAKQYYYEIWKAQNQDNIEYKNSIITFMKIDNREWERLIRNKKVLYTKE